LEFSRGGGGSYLRIVCGWGGGRFPLFAHMSEFPFNETLKQRLLSLATNLTKKIYFCNIFMTRYFKLLIINVLKRRILYRVFQ
jgi:hypothetical protein